MPPIPFNRLKLNLIVNSPIDLPAFAGSMFRGGFGAALKRSCCTMPRRNCAHCMLQTSCAYASLFETGAVHAAKGEYQLKDFPRPFVIEPPFPAPRRIEKNQTLACHLVLMGPAINYMPYFVYAFNQLGRTGLGKSRGKYHLNDIEDALDKDRQIIFEGMAQQFRNSPTTLTMETCLDNQPDSDELTLTFQTPTRIKHQNRLTKILPFDLLLKNLIRRINLLARVCDTAPHTADYTLLLEQARTVRQKQSSLYWYDWRRYSSRQDTTMQLGGFMGSVTFQGDFTSFLPYIRMGSYLHVGKACTFGLGRYRIYFK